jgi:hypothetical protein
LTLDVRSVLWRVIREQVGMYFRLDDVWFDGEQKRRESILREHVYQGNVFHPNFFVELCDILQFESQRKWYGNPMPELLFGEQMDLPLQGAVVEEVVEEKD